MKKQALIFILTLLTSNVNAVQVCKDYILNDTPDYRYTVHGDGTITDTATNLMWQQCSLGQSGSDCSIGIAITMTWQGALQAGADSTLASHTDWRLPNVKELSSIVAYNCYSPSINETVFPSSVTGPYWSSSPYSYNSINRAWSVFFNYGFSSVNARSSIYSVRLVR